MEQQVNPQIRIYLASSKQKEQVLELIKLHDYKNVSEFIRYLIRKEIKGAGLNP